MILFFAGLGAVLASFTGVLVERLYTGQSWAFGRSRCDSCGVPLSARDLVPVLSWALSGGACRSCGSRIPLASFVFEVLLGTLFALSFHVLGLGIFLVLFLAALTVLGFIVLYDIRHTIVPVPASVSLALLSLAAAFVASPDLHFFGGTILTAGIIALGFFLLHTLSGGRAMGLGDAPVAFALSLLVAPFALSGLLFSFWIGATVGILMLVMRRGGPTMGIEVPFVPFLAAGYILAYFLRWNPLALLI